jgi:transposase
MPKGTVLSNDERKEILRLHAAGVSGREIGKSLNRSKTVVLNFLRNPNQYAQIKRSGRKRALSIEEERRLFSQIFQEQNTLVLKSAAQIKREYNLPLSTRRIQQLLSDWRARMRKEKDLGHSIGQGSRHSHENLKEHSDFGTPSTQLFGLASESITYGALLTVASAQSEDEEEERNEVKAIKIPIDVTIEL